MSLATSALTLRDFVSADTDRVNRIALAAFSQFAVHYDDWPKLAASVSRMSDLATSGEIIVAEVDGEIAGAVAYIPPGAPKAAFFEPNWPVIRSGSPRGSARRLESGRRLFRRLCLNCGGWWQTASG